MRLSHSHLRIPSKFWYHEKSLFLGGFCKPQKQEWEMLCSLAWEAQEHLDLNFSHINFSWGLRSVANLNLSFDTIFSMDPIGKLLSSFPRHVRALRISHSSVLYSWDYRNIGQGILGNLAPTWKPCPLILYHPEILLAIFCSWRLLVLPVKVALMTICLKGSFSPHQMPSSSQSL